MTDTAVRTWNGLTIPAPGLYVLDEPHRRVGFQAEHLMVSTVRGEFTRVAATILVAEDPMQSAVTAVIEAASITTGHEERDAHLRSPDFLDVDRYPTLTYRSTGMRRYEENPIFQWARLRTLGRNGPAGHPDTLTRQSLSVARKFILTGELTVKGVTRPVDLDVTYTGTRRNPGRPAGLRLSGHCRDRPHRLRPGVERAAGRRGSAGRAEGRHRAGRGGGPPADVRGRRRRDGPARARHVSSYRLTTRSSNSMPMPGRSLRWIAPSRTCSRLSSVSRRSKL
jgi:polyisoprenoid-binding protein YceI